MYDATLCLLAAEGSSFTWASQHLGTVSPVTSQDENLKSAPIVSSHEPWARKRGGFWWAPW